LQHATESLLHDYGCIEILIARTYFLHFQSLSLFLPRSLLTSSAAMPLVEIAPAAIQATVAATDPIIRAQ